MSKRVWNLPTILTLLSSWLVDFNYATAEFQPHDGPIAFVGAQLLDGYESPAIHDAVVIIENGRIVASGPRYRTTIPTNAFVINLGGKTIMPGLIDAHAHMDLIGHGSYERYYAFLNGMERLPEVMPIAAKQMLRAGVTTALDLGAPFQILAFRERIRRGEIPGPHLLISGPWITRQDYETIPDEYEVVISSPEDAAQKTRELIERGSDVIKTWVGLSEEDYRAIVQEAHKAGVKVHAHLYAPEAIRRAIDAGVDVLQHVGSARNPPYDEALVSEIAHRNIPVIQTIAHRIWVYPATVDFPERLLRPEYPADMQADVYKEFLSSFEDFHRLPYFQDIGQEIRNAKRSASQFIKAGAYMGVGTDAASPLNTHLEAIWREMSALVESGMTPLQVISAATKTNAEILGIIERTGTIEPGKAADLIVVNGNPLANIERLADVRLVVRGGMLWYPESEKNSGVATIGYPF